MKKILASALALLTFAIFTASAGENRRIQIVNRSSVAIRYFYASNVDVGTWQEDILGPGRMIWPDHYMNAIIDDGTGHCLYDMKAVLFDGREAVWRNYNVCTKSTVTVTD